MRSKSDQDMTLQTRSIFFGSDIGIVHTYVLSIENGKLKKRDGRFFLIPCEDKHPLVGDQSVDEFFQTRVLRYP